MVYVPNFATAIKVAEHDAASDAKARRYGAHLALAKLQLARDSAINGLVASIARPIVCEVCGEAANTVPYSMAGTAHRYGPTSHPFTRR